MEHQKIDKNVPQTTLMGKKGYTCSQCGRETKSLYYDIHAKHIRGLCRRCYFGDFADEERTPKVNKNVN